MARHSTNGRSSVPNRPVDHRRRSLMALSPAALGAAGFFLSGLNRRPRDSDPPGGASGDSSEGSRLTEHRKAFYNRARF